MVIPNDTTTTNSTNSNKGNTMDQGVIFTTVGIYYQDMHLVVAEGKCITSSLLTHCIYLWSIGVVSLFPLSFNANEQTGITKWTFSLRNMSGVLVPT